MREMLRRWLGVDKAEAEANRALNYALAVRKMIEQNERVIIDLGVKPGDTTIIVASQLMGGRVYAFHHSFENMKAFTEFMDSRFPGWHSGRRSLVDAPPMFQDFLKHWRG